MINAKRMIWGCQEQR